jgi:hypothetical protein
MTEPQRVFTVATLGLRSLRSLRHPHPGLHTPFRETRPFTVNTCRPCRPFRSASSNPALADRAIECRPFRPPERGREPIRVSVIVGDHNGNWPERVTANRPQPIIR